MKTEEYQMVNGTSYNKETSEEVIRILEHARVNNTRIRVFYGDTETGCDWLEENDTIGTIGRSTGSIKIPLLIKSSRSYCGCSLLDNYIVKITINKQVVYEHPLYNTGELTIASSGYSEYPAGIFVNNENHANFKNTEEAEKYIKFITGESNRK